MIIIKLSYILNNITHFQTSQPAVLSPLKKKFILTVHEGRSSEEHLLSMKHDVLGKIWLLWDPDSRNW